MVEANNNHEAPQRILVMLPPQSVPQDPASPAPLLLVLLAFGLGMLAGAVLALLWR